VSFATTVTVSITVVCVADMQLAFESFHLAVSCSEGEPDKHSTQLDQEVGAPICAKAMLP